MLSSIRLKSTRFLRKSRPQAYRAYCTKRQPTLDSIIVPKEASVKTANLGKVKLDGTTGRFYKNVEVVKVKNHYEIEFDGFAMLSRGENRIKFPNEDIAMAVASDWEFFHKRIDPKRMPLYTLASGATDMNITKRLFTEESVLELIDSDVVILRNSANATFNALQVELHDPLIQWFEEEFGVKLNITDSLSNCQFHEQPRETMHAIFDIIKKMDNWSFVAFGSLVESTLSVVISLALWHRKISVENAFRASKAEHLAFDAQFGEVEGSTDVRNQYLYTDIAASTLFLHLLGTPPPTKKNILKANKKV